MGALLGTKIPTILPGDLLGFSADGCLGCTINAATAVWPFPPRRWRGISHVAVAAEGPPDTAWRGLCWESTALFRRPCLWCDTIHDGLQLHRIHSRVKHYPGAVWHYPLRKPLDPIRRAALWEAAESIHARPYDYSGAAGSVLGWLLGQRMREPDLRALFCSEAVAWLWSTSAVWDAPNPSQWNPNLLVRTALATGIVGRPVRLK